MKIDRDKIQEIIDCAEEVRESGKGYKGQTYEEGIIDALLWVLNPDSEEEYEKPSWT